MDPDSMADESGESDPTYQAFDSSGEVSPPRRLSGSPSRTELQPETPAWRRPEGSGGAARRGSEWSGGNPSAQDAFGSSDDVIPVDSQGNLFGKYRVLSKIGSGGMGHIWLVEHVRLRRQSALKVIKSELAESAAGLHRFQREAEILAQLSRHPNAVPVHDADVVGKFAYIEMDYLPGQNLKQRLDDVGLMTLQDVAWFLGEACAVLGEAHARAIVHRDIKPTNIMIVPDPSAPRGERVKVLDFGIAKILRDPALDTASLSLQTEGYLGTYPYSSPEQLGLPLPGRREPAAVDLRSDIYSLGVLLYEMLVGTRPFSGMPTKLLYDHVHTPPPPFSESAPEVHIPPEVEAVVRRSLEKDPVARFQSVDELLRAFCASVEAVEVTHAPRAFIPASRAPAPAADRPAEVELGAAVATGSAARAWRSPRLAGLSSWWRPAAIAAAASLLVAALAWFVLRSSLESGNISTERSAFPPTIQNWLDQHQLDPVGPNLSRESWPERVKRKGPPARELVLIGAHYLPAGFRTEDSAAVNDEGLPKVLVSEKTGSRFILIEGGDFRMGAFKDDPSLDFDKLTERPGHMVTLSSYYLQECEVSIGEFAKFCQDKGLKSSDAEVESFYKGWYKQVELLGAADKNKVDDYPATDVSHRMAVAFARWIGGDLPTEAQWEYAARSRGKLQRFVWSDAEDIDPANRNRLARVFVMDDGPCEVHFDGNKDRTAQGIYHMAGNVREWCRDVWKGYQATALSDPVGLPEEGESDPDYAIRGASYLTSTESRRVTWRHDQGRPWKMKESESDDDVGFRVVLEVLRRPDERKSADQIAAREEVGR